MSQNFHWLTELLRIHGSVMKSGNFPGFPDDHGIITDSLTFTDSGITESLVNSEMSIVLLTKHR